MAIGIPGLGPPRSRTPALESGPSHTNLYGDFRSGSNLVSGLPTNTKDSVISVSARHVHFLLKTLCTELGRWKNEKIARACVRDRMRLGGVSMGRWGDGGSAWLSFTTVWRAGAAQPVAGKLYQNLFFCLCGFSVGCSLAFQPRESATSQDCCTARPTVAQPWCL